MVKTAPPGPSRRHAAAGKSRPTSRAAAAGARPRCAGAGCTGSRRAESKISRVDAQGHVVVTNAIDTGRGDFGVYNAETGIATLIGNVVDHARQGRDPGPVRGVMDLNNNVSRMLPRRRARRAAPSGCRACSCARTEARAAQTAPAAAQAAPHGRARSRDARRRPTDGRRAMPGRPGSAEAGRVSSPTIAAWSGTGSARASSAGRCCATSTSRCSAARWSGCSAPTAPARRPASTSSPA